MHSLCQPGIAVWESAWNMLSMSAEANAWSTSCSAWTNKKYRSELSSTLIWDSWSFFPPLLHNLFIEWMNNIFKVLLKKKQHRRIKINHKIKITQQECFISILVATKSFHASLENTACYMDKLQQLQIKALRKKLFFNQVVCLTVLL